MLVEIWRLEAARAEAAVIRVDTVMPRRKSRRCRAGEGGDGFMSDHAFTRFMSGLSSPNAVIRVLQADVSADCDDSLARVGNSWPAARRPL